MSTRTLTEENLYEIKKAGIDAIEVCVPAAENKKINFIELKKIAEKTGIMLWSYHLQFMNSPEISNIDISNQNKAERELAIKHQSELIKRGAEAGIDKFVIHPCSYEPITEDIREEKIKCSLDSLAALSDVADICGGVIAVEDLPRTNLCNTTEEMLHFMNENDKLRICFDTNHLLKGEYVDFIKKLGDKIITMHVSDYDFVNERHWLPGEGLIDWAMFMDEFEKIGYQGVWMYEIGLRTPMGVSRERNLTYEDVYKNAKSIFKKEKPWIIGKMQENIDIGYYPGYEDIIKNKYIW